VSKVARVEVGGEGLHAVALGERALAALEAGFPAAAARFHAHRAREAARRLRRLGGAVTDVLRSQRALLSLVAHDLRSPLIALLDGGLERVLRDTAHYGPLSPEQARVLGRARRSALFLRQLIDEIAEIGGSDAGVARAERTSVAEVLTEAVLETVAAVAPARLDGVPEAADFETLRGALAGHGPLLEADPDSLRAPILTDRSRLRRVLANLLSNAMKHAGDPVEVRARRVDGQLEVAVLDRGPGIPERFRELVFARLRQPEVRAAGAPRGFGLGLAAARELVQSLGGSIRAEAGEGGVGTSILFRIPWRDAPEGP
jgi:two-component system sensor histidine kinase KdpD